MRKGSRTGHIIAGCVLAVAIIAAPAVSGALMGGYHTEIIDPAPNGMDMIRVPERYWRDPDGTMITPDADTIA